METDRIHGAPQGEGTSRVGPFRMQEGQFLQERMESFRSRIRFVAALTAVLYAAAGYADWLDLGPGPDLVLMLSARGGVALLGLCVAAAFGVERFPVRGLLYPLGAYMFAVMCCESLELVLKTTYATNGGIPATTFIVLCYYVFLPFRVWLLLVPGVAGSVLYMASMAFLTPARPQDVWVVFLFFLLSNLFGAWFLRRLELAQRNEFRALARLRLLAETDPLTGIFNRRRGLELAMREFRRAKRYEEPFSVLMLDLDRFKRVNDKHGHEAGDRVLMEFARRAGGVLREVDVFVRLGGEEFGVFLPSSNLDQASVAARRILEAVSGRSFDAGRVRLDVTVSAGTAGMRADDEDLTHILRRADDALYRAKQGGRNRVCLEEADAGAAAP